MHKQNALEAILKQKFLPLYYNESAEVSVKILRTLYAAGVRTVEYTNRGEKALANFREMMAATKTEMPGMLLGIGTIKTAEQARDFIEAGAKYIICPTVNPEVAAVTHQAGLLWIPGCLTPTEISVAEMNGAGLVKIFPGNILGPEYISSIKELFPAIRFMPTGGVEAEENNLRKWFNAGVVAVGMGSKLISKDIIDRQDFTSLQKNTEETLKLVQHVAP